MRSLSLISVCVATFKRNERLANLLEKLANQNTGNTFIYEVIIVDNDSERGAENIVRNMIEEFPVKLIYDCEPQKNISLARNKGIELASGCYIAFIDDDEEPVQNWLLAHFETLQACPDSFATHGPVRSTFPNSAPKWIIKSDFFVNEEHTEGDFLINGKTSNALVLRKKMSQLEYLFDPRFGLTGGGDSDLFRRLLQLGGNIVWSEKAIVFEEIEEKRLNIKWLVMRSLRSGIGFSEYKIKNLNLIQKIQYFIKRLLFTILAFSFFILTIPLGRSKSIWWLRKTYANLGHLLAFTKFRYKEYR